MRKPFLLRIAVLTVTAVITLVGIGIEQNTLTYAESETSSKATESVTEAAASKKAQAQEKRYAKRDKKALKQQKVAATKYAIASYIRKRGVSWKNAYRFADHFYRYAKRYNVKVSALLSIAQHESNFREKAVNSYGYYGMMQCSSAIARQFAGVRVTKLLNAKYAIKAGAGYFKYNLRYLKTYRMAMAGYCAGTYGAKAGNYSRSMVNSRIRVMNRISKYIRNKKKAA